MSYRYNGDISELSVTQTAFAQYIGYTQQQVSKMLAKGELAGDDSDNASRIMLADSLKEYFLAQKAQNDTAKYWKEKAIREKVNRELDELKLRTKRGELYEAATIEAAWIEIITVLKNNLLGLPSKLALQLENKPRDDIYRVLTAELENLLSEVQPST